MRIVMAPPTKIPSITYTRYIAHHRVNDYLALGWMLARYNDRFHPAMDQVGDRGAGLVMVWPCECKCREPMRRRTMPATVSTDHLAEVTQYFERKTEGILERYGPGPRVHYHTGLMDKPPATGASIAELKQSLRASQERMLEHAAGLWPDMAVGNVLDVGCGLGGGAIFWALHGAVSVTAVTCVPSHIDLVRQFADQAGLWGQVNPLLCDALRIPGEALFDAAVAIDSSGYLDRHLWFKRLAKILKPRACIHVIDCFLGSESYRTPFDAHWRTRIGTIDEYLEAARAAGFEHEYIKDLNQRTVGFWSTTLQLLQAELRAGKTNDFESSFAAHNLVRDGLSNGGLDYAIATWRNAS